MADDAKQLAAWWNDRAAMVQAVVDDEMHEHFCGKLGFSECNRYICTREFDGQKYDGLTLIFEKSKRKFRTAHKNESIKTQRSML